MKEESMNEKDRAQRLAAGDRIVSHAREIFTASIVHNTARPEVALERAVAVAVAFEAGTREFREGLHEGLEGKPSRDVVLDEIREFLQQQEERTVATSGDDQIMLLVHHRDYAISLLKRVLESQ